MAKAKQLTVSVENRPGTLAQVARVLGDAKVNILGFLTGTSGEKGWVELVVDRPNKAKKALDGSGLRYTEKAVLHVQLPNVPGALARFAGKLADKDINITSGHQTSVKGARKASVVLAVSNLDEAARVR